MAQCNLSIIVNGPKLISIKESGFYSDARPGHNPNYWQYNNTYAWPVPPLRETEKLQHIPRTLFRQPITLLPAMLDPAWDANTDTTSPYARRRLDHFDILQGSFEEYPRLNAQDWVMSSKQSDSILRSKEPLLSGQGLALHLRGFSPELSNSHIAEVTFGHPDITKAYRLNITGDGHAYLVRGNASNPASKDRLADGDLVPNRWDTLFHKWLKIFILPHARNRILVTSSAGGGLMYQDYKDIPDVSPVDVHKFGLRPKELIIPGPYQVRTLPRVDHQSRPIAYVGTPNIMGMPPNTTGGTFFPKGQDLMSFHRQPDMTKLIVRNVFDAYHGGMNDAHVLTSYQTPAPKNPDGTYGMVPTVTMVRPNRSHEDQHYTPIYYRTEPYIPPTSQSKVDEGVDVIDDMIELHHHHAEVTSGSIKLRNPQNHISLRRSFNIPIQFKDNSNIYVEGILTDPKMEFDGINSYCAWTIADKMKSLEVPLADVPRFDGSTIDDAVKLILISLGFNPNGSEWDIDTSLAISTGRKLSRISQAETDNEPTNLADVVKTGNDWIKYLVETYTSSSEFPFRWVYGFRPYFNTGTGKYVYKFFLKNPANMNTSVKTWYATHADAITAGVSQSNSRYAVHQNWKDQVFEPECNALLVVGQDDNGNTIMRYQEDKTSIDATVALSSQKANHLGTRRLVIVIDTALNQVNDVTTALGLLFKRLSKARIQITFEAEWAPTVRIWDLITLDSYTGWSVEGFTANAATRYTLPARVTNIEVSHEQDCDNTPGLIKTRHAIYTVETWYSDAAKALNI